jgi:hypothetical protein
MKKIRDLWNWLRTNWERALFTVVGLGFFVKCFDLVIRNSTTDAAVIFGLGFLSFIFANIARFKRFKGFGIEGELWENKQQEAADLIERLRDVVTIYTRELVLGKVKAGRWGPRSKWKDHWALYDELITQHAELGQKIDFSSLKNEIDTYFLFDMTRSEISKIRDAATNGRREAEQRIQREFGIPVHDNEGYNKRWQQLSAIQCEFRNAFDISKRNNLAEHVLTVWYDTKRRLKQDFDIDTDIEPEIYERLKAISKLYQARPVNVTAELIQWADHEE